VTSAQRQLFSGWLNFWRDPGGSLGNGSQLFSHLPEMQAALHSGSEVQGAPIGFGSPHLPAMQRSSRSQSPPRHGSPAFAMAPFVHFPSRQREPCPHSGFDLQAPPSAATASQRLRSHQPPPQAGWRSSKSSWRVYTASGSTAELHKRP